jgi:hypothetical protein
MSVMATRRRAPVFLAILAATLLHGCWTQTDSVSIGRDGVLEFVSSVVIDDQSQQLKTADVEKISQEFMDGLTQAGWTVTRAWVSQARPYGLKFTGRGSLKSVRGTSAFYELTKVSDTEFRIRFLAAERQGLKSTRAVAFTAPAQGAAATVLEADGKPVTRIDRVDSTKTYSIRLQ